METCKENRLNSQPLEYHNCGSIFKNPENYKAWELIEKVNLRGYKKNGAMISDKHCNFIVNVSKASGDDVLFLINLVEEKIKKQIGVTIEREIMVID